MRFGHVLCDGAVATSISAYMCGNALTLMKALHCATRDTDIQLLFDQLIRDRVVMGIHFNMVINADIISDRFGIPVGDDVGGR